jgi:hypothetical protein
VAICTNHSISLCESLANMAFGSTGDSGERVNVQAIDEKNVSKSGVEVEGEKRHLTDAKDADDAIIGK